MAPKTLKKTIKSQRIKCSDLEKCANRVLCLVLADIMKAKVVLECLTDAQIENIQKIGVNNWEKSIQKNISKMSTPAFVGSNVANETSQYSPSYNDTSSIDSDDIWNTSIQTDDDNEDNSLLIEQNISQQSETDSNASSAYRMSESDLQDIFNDDSNMASNNMSGQNNDDPFDSWSEFSDKLNDFNDINGSLETDDDQSEMDDEEQMEEEEEEEEEEDDWGDLDEMIGHITNNNDGGTKNMDENGESWRSVGKIFNQVCLKSLHNKCNVYGSLCRFNHELPEPTVVFRNLQRAEIKDIEEAHQKLLMRYDKLLVKYWATFCSFYGRGNYREYLRLSIGPLSLMEGLCTEYNLLSHIVEGFLKTGMNYNLCVKQILIELDESLGSADEFYLVWQIILDPRNTAIKTHLEHFTTVMLNDLSSLNVAAIKEMISIQIANESMDIRAMTVAILERCNVAIFQSIDSTLLTEYVLHLRAFDEIGSKVIQQRTNQFHQRMR